MRKIISNILAVYLGTGVVMGFMMKSAIPAINYYGVAYITVFWSHLMFYTHIGLDPMPPMWLIEYMFTFER